MCGALAEASGINLRGCHQDLDPGSLELVMDRAQIVYPPEAGAMGCPERSYKMKLIRFALAGRVQHGSLKATKSNH